MEYNLSKGFQGRRRVFFGPSAFGEKNTSIQTQRSEVFGPMESMKTESVTRVKMSKSEQYVWMSQEFSKWFWKLRT